MKIHRKHAITFAACLLAAGLVVAQDAADKLANESAVIGALMGSVYPVIVIVVLMQRRTKQEFIDWANYYLSGGK